MQSWDSLKGRIPQWILAAQDGLLNAISWIHPYVSSPFHQFSYLYKPHTMSLSKTCRSNTKMCTTKNLSWLLLQFFLPILGKGKVKCTLVQALRLCTGRTAHRGSRGIAVPFHDHGTRREWGDSVTPRERPGTHFTGCWVGSRTGLNRCGKSRPHWDSIPRPSSP
jgi:hypothetical protein